MPRPRLPTRLWLRPARRDAAGEIRNAACWFILDGGEQISTGCGAGDSEAAERKLAQYIERNRAPERRERALDKILVSDVIKIYLDDVACNQARPAKASERAVRLLTWFGEKSLNEVTGAACRAYEASRAGQGHARKGKGGGARRDLQDLAAAINHHAELGYHRGIVKVPLPKRGERRQRWITRAEFERLLFVVRTTREVQEGTPTAKRPLKHLFRYLWGTLQTGSRPGAWLNASWERAPKRAWVDVDNGLFYRQPEDTVPNNKRQPPVPLNGPLLRRLRLWRAQDRAAGLGHGYVVTFGGKPVASVKTALARACKLAAIETGITAYSMRHSAATWLVSEGWPFAKVAKLLGTTEAMIEQHYAHFSPDYLQDVSAALGRRK